MGFFSEGGSADYLVTGTWSSKAAVEVKLTTIQKNKYINRAFHQSFHLIYINVNFEHRQKNMDR